MFFINLESDLKMTETQTKFDYKFLFLTLAILGSYAIHFLQIDINNGIAENMNGIVEILGDLGEVDWKLINLIEMLGRFHGLGGPQIKDFSEPLDTNVLKMVGK